GGLAYLAQQFVQSDLSRGTGSEGAGEIFGFHQSGDVQQLRWRALEVVCGQYRADGLPRLVEARIAGFQLRGDEPEGRKLRGDSPYRAFGGLRSPRDEARAGGCRGHEDLDLARHRY